MMPWYRTLAYLLHTFDSELTLGFTDEEVEDMMKKLSP